MSTPYDPAQSHDQNIKTAILENPLELEQLTEMKS